MPGSFFSSLGTTTGVGSARVVVGGLHVGHPISNVSCQPIDWTEYMPQNNFVTDVQGEKLGDGGDGDEHCLWNVL